MARYFKFLVLIIASASLLTNVQVKYEEKKLI
jgi:hypothetical protein